jgi:gliding motility-associated lipoprotein GldH
LKRSFLLLLPLFLFLAACNKINVYEKHAAIPGFSWSKTFAPQFEFENTSAQSRYRIFLVVRHTNAYKYGNLWVRLNITPKGDSTQSEEFNIALTRNNEQWAGTGMDDIYELRRELKFQKIRLEKDISACTFSLEQIMRDDPLKNIMNVGLRIEKKP